jgi:hypothetical protein
VGLRKLEWLALTAVFAVDFLGVGSLQLVHDDWHSTLLRVPG